MRLVAMILCAGLVAGGAVGEPVELFSCSFDGPSDLPCVNLVEPATLADGLLHSSSQDAWRRRGLEVGPLKLPEGGIEVAYDFRPVKLGRQGQSFVSQVPHTHWYMLYADAGGALHLHTRQGGQWQQRGMSTSKVQVGRWYHARVSLTRTSIHLVLTDQDSGEQVWDTGAVAVDDVGDATVFMLTDESADAGDCATEWDRLSVSTADAAYAKAFVGDQQQAREARRRRLERLAEMTRAAEELDRRGLALIPMPQHVRFGDGGLELGKLGLSGADDAVKVVNEVLRERTGRKLPERSSGPLLTLKTVTDGPWPRPVTRACEGYHLSVTASGIVLEAETVDGFRDGARTLAQLAAGATVPVVDVVDWPAIENRLVMIALSQGGWRVIDVEYWKRLISELAAVKVNLLMPYMDGGTFDYRKYPYLCLKGAGGLTVEKARLLSDYAAAHGIEIVPQQQTLGHAGGMLGHPELAGLRESGGVFCSSKSEVFAFFEDLFDDLVEAFPYARYIHVGGDEFAHGFAQCPLCKERAAEIGPEALYAEHLMHVHKLLADRRRGMMIWWHEQGYTEAAADKLAKDIIVFDWHYGNQRAYPSLARLRKLGFTPWATPAVTRYYNATNDFDTTFGNLRGFLTEAADEGIPGECTCTWVHGLWGGRNHFELNWYALLYSAQCAWNPAGADEADYRRRFARHWFGLQGGDLSEQVLNAWHQPFGTTAEQGFWRNCRDAEPVLAETPAETLARLKDPTHLSETDRLMGFCTRARGILEQWRKEARRNQVTVDFLIHDVHIYETLVRRLRAMDMLRRTYAAARAAPAEKRQAILQPALDALAALVGDYRELEHMFDRSVLEAGGGPCGQMQLNAGGVIFRAPQGRERLEKLIANLRALDPQAEWAEVVW